MEAGSKMVSSSIMAARLNKYLATRQESALYAIEDFKLQCQAVPYFAL